MTYDELIEALAGLSGRMVETTIRTPYEDPEGGQGASGTGRSLAKSTVSEMRPLAVRSTGRSTGAKRRERDPMRDRSRFGAAASRGQR
jgi:hypothetical protein